MKFKYFLRGLGTGILFAAIIFLTAYQGDSSHRISDAEVVRRAQELGMVKKNDPIKDLITTEKKTSEEQVAETKKTTEEKTTEATTEKKTTEKKTEEVTTEKKTTEEKTTEATTEKKTTEEKTTEATTENKTTEKETNTNKNETIKLTIQAGESSYPVCQRLKELGLIDDADKFDNYLIENNYANRLQIGEHILKKGMDYHAIAEAISDPI